MARQSRWPALVFYRVDELSRLIGKFCKASRLKAKSLDCPSRGKKGRLDMERLKRYLLPSQGHASHL